ncbi:MAG: helix-turn-helix transcriptional regulator [Synergistaceae bacterium]|nr:helix-turn-helix transcriptional regulator [Synergistaceae bacterium]
MAILANILAMNIMPWEQKTPDEIAAELARKVRARRRAFHLSQSELSRKADVSLGSLKRFEQSGEISLRSLIKIAVALECEEEFSALFSKKHYASIQEVIDEQDKIARGEV